MTPSAKTPPFSPSAHFPFAGGLVVECARLCAPLLVLFAAGMMRAQDASIAGIASGTLQAVEPPLPIAKLEGPVTTISEFLAYGPWKVAARGDWHNNPAPLPMANGRMQWAELEKPPFNGMPRLTGDAIGGVDFAQFADDANNWKGHHILLLACKVVAAHRAPAVLSITNDDNVFPYVNGRFTGVVTGEVKPGGGQSHAAAVMLYEGENVLLFRIPATDRVPRFKVDVVTDGSRDFDAAWRRDDGLLTRLVYSPEHPNEKPSVQWTSTMGNMVVQAYVTDIYTREDFQTQPLRRGDTLLFPGREERGGGEVDLDIRGAYSIRYQNGPGLVEEQFFIGDPRKMKARLEIAARKLCRDPKTQINASALLRRLEVLCRPENYKLDDRRWQEKTAHAICSLAGLLGTLDRNIADPARDTPGLHIRGFASSLDISTQHYRLFVPGTYKRGQKLPLLVILPTAVSASQRPFLESPFIANHHDAVCMGRVAEKYGFALLWSGYRNTPAGLPCENAHLDEVLKAVQADYDLDLQRIHLYGVCGGGFFAGNVAARWPNRFASIIYNRAIFNRDPNKMPNLSKEEKEWLRVSDPTESILRNDAISIFLTNTENVDEGHGEIELSYQFLEKAAKLNKNVIPDFSPPDIADTHWDRILRWAASCRLEKPDDKISDHNRRNGYSGPAMEVFATPVIIVQGTAGTKAENDRIDKCVWRIQGHHAGTFHGAECRVRKDTDITDAEISGNSLIIVGNPATNKLWGRLHGESALRINADEVVLGRNRWIGKLACHFVSTNKQNPSRYVLFIGATDLECLSFYPVKSLFGNIYDFILLRMGPMGTPQPVAIGKSQKFLEHAN